MSTCPAGHQSQASDYCDTCGRVIGGAAAAPNPVPEPAAASAVSGAGAPGSGASGRAGCPVCGAARDGRFCEECGYDFELAEAMPEAAAELVASSSSVTSNSATPEPVPAAESGAAEPGGGPGLDLEAELARAEAQASEPVAVPAPSPEPSPSPAAEAGPAFGGAPYPVTLPGEELNLVVDADRGYYDAQVERGDIIEGDFPFPKYPAERRFSFSAGPVRIGRSSASRGLSPEIDLTGPPLDPAVSHLHAQLLRHEEGWVVVDLASANGTRLNDSAEPLAAETEIPVKSGDRIHLGVWTTIVVQ